MDKYFKRIDPHKNLDFGPRNNGDNDNNNLFASEELQKEGSVCIYQSIDHSPDHVIYQGTLRVRAHLCETVSLHCACSRVSVHSRVTF